MQTSVEIYDAVNAVAAEWDELALRLGSSPFARPGWFSCWLDAFGSVGLRVVALRRDGGLAAVLPVLERRGTVRSATNWHTPAYGPVAEDDAAAEELFAALFRTGPRRVDLSFVASESAERLRAAAGRRSFASRVVQRSPYVAIEGDWESYLGGLSRNVRGNLGRRRRRIAERGELAVEVFEGGGALPALLRESFQLEASGWKGEQSKAILSSPETLRFYERLAGWAAEVGMLRLALLRLDGRTIAFNLSLEAEGRHYLLKLGHDASLDDLSPGTVLTGAMIERAFALGLKSYEFLGGPDPYKLRWTSACHDFVRAQAFAGSPSGALDRFVQTRGRAVTRRLLARRDA
jgi:CelD/BcsL family acetyltransferase involved in cellulose biosynthesis